MNWVGGTMSRIRGRDDKKIQREFFEKKRYEKTLDTIPLGLQSPTKKKELSISQDLLSLQTVLQTHREDNDRLNRPLKQPNKLDFKPKVGQKRMISHEVFQGSGGSERGLVVEEGFQNLETPTSFLDLKRWRGENRPSKTLGMCKVPNLRHFQELEQTVYRREGVEVQAEKENLHSVEERDSSLPLSEGVDSARKDVELRRDEERESIQWNKNVCEEPSKAGTDTKWLEFLYGCNKPRQQRPQYLAENVQADMTTQFPSVHLPLPSSRPLSPHLNPANLQYYEGEDLMEFERMNLAKPQRGNSEDPLYLTLTSNRDSFKGYKRPRIDSSLGFASGVGAGAVVGGRVGHGGYLDESVFATPAEGNIIRPDGMLTENPLPQSHKVALRSIKDFVLERSPIEESEDSSVPLDGIEDINEPADLPEVAQPTIPCEHKHEKGKFIAPFITKNKSPDVLTTASGENRPSKSYDSFLHSLITSEETERGKRISGIMERGNIGLAEMNGVQEESCMMSIVEWKSKESNRKIEDVTPIRADSADKETPEKRGSYAMESVSSLLCRDENVERSHLEVELREREFDYGNQSANEDENSIEFLSTHSTQGTDVEMKERELETVLAENLDSLREEQKVETTMYARDVHFEEYDTSDFVNEVINNAIRKMLSSDLFDKKSPNWQGANVENTSFQSIRLSLVTHNESFDQRNELNQIVMDTSFENTSAFDFGLNNSTIEETKATDLKNMIVVTRITEEDDLTMPIEFDEKAIQYSQQSPKVILMNAAVGSPLHTDSKYCQSVVKSSDRDCQTEESITSYNNMISHETEVGTKVASNIMLSQAIQTELLLTRAEKEIQTDLLQDLFPTLPDSERAADIREDYEKFILQQQQIILALEKEIEVLKLNSDN